MESTFQSRVFALVSIPNGLPRPFSQIQNDLLKRNADLFQSRTGFPGHLATVGTNVYYGIFVVSIPNGLPRPFSLPVAVVTVTVISSFNPERASQAI